MKSISVFFFFVMMLFCATNQTTNAQENKTPQQIKEKQANYDGLVADLRNLASSAQEYYKKHVSLSGGGNRFTVGLFRLMLIQLQTELSPRKLKNPK